MRRTCLRNSATNCPRPSGRPVRVLARADNGPAIGSSRGHLSGCTQSRGIHERTERHPKAWADFEEKCRKYAIGLLLAEHREKSGLSLSQLAKQINMQKAALSRLENHGEDLRLSTLARYVEATGRPRSLRIFPSAGSVPDPTASV
jgi:DNA-binding XRE family transcriptional regulator